MARPVWGFPGLWHLTQEASGPLVIDYHWLFHQNKPKNSIGIPRFWILFNHHFCCWKIMLNHLKSNLFVANPHKQSDDNWKLNPRANSQPLVRWFFFGQAASLWMPAFKRGGKVCCVNNRPGDVRLVVFSHFSPIFLYILSRWWLQHIPILRNLTFGQVKKGGFVLGNKRRDEPSDQHFGFNKGGCVERGLSVGLSPGVATQIGMFRSVTRPLIINPY